MPVKFGREAPKKNCFIYYVRQDREGSERNPSPRNPGIDAEIVISGRKPEYGKGILFRRNDRNVRSVPESACDKRVRGC